MDLSRMDTHHLASEPKSVAARQEPDSLSLFFLVFKTGLLFVLADEEESIYALRVQSLDSGGILTSMCMRDLVARGKRSAPAKAARSGAGVGSCRR